MFDQNYVTEKKLCKFWAHSLKDFAVYFYGLGNPVSTYVSEHKTCWGMRGHIQDVLGHDPQKTDSGMEIFKQEVYWGVLLATTVRQEYI